MNLLEHISQHRDKDKELSDRQKKLLDSCISGIFMIDKELVEKVYKEKPEFQSFKSKYKRIKAIMKEKSDDFSISIHPIGGIGVAISIDNKDVTDWNKF